MVINFKCIFFIPVPVQVLTTFMNGTEFMVERATHICHLFYSHRPLNSIDQLIDFFLFLSKRNLILFHELIFAFLGTGVLVGSRLPTHHLVVYIAPTALNEVGQPLHLIMYTSTELCSGVGSAWIRRDLALMNPDPYYVCGSGPR